MLPRLPITIRGRKRSVQLDAILDSGFDGQICLPVRFAVELGLELVGRVRLELADGRRRQRLLYRCEVEIADEIQLVDAFLTSGEDALIGTKLMSGFRLTIDFDTGAVRRVTLKRRKR